MQYASRVDVDFDVVAVAVAFAVAVSDATSSTSRTHMRQIFGRFVLLWRRRSSCRGQLINMHLVSSAERERERESGREREGETASQADRESEGDGELSPPATAEIHWKSAQKGRASFALVSALGYLEMPLAILAMLAELPYIKVSCSGPSAYKYVRVALTVAALRQVASQLSTRNQITHTQPPAGHAKQCRQLRLQLKLLLPLPLQLPFPSSSDALCMSSAVLRERGLKVLTDVGRGRGV